MELIDRYAGYVSWEAQAQRALAFGLVALALEDLDGGQGLKARAQVSVRGQLECTRVSPA